jgi:hypothetical protein
VLCYHYWCFPHFVQRQAVSIWSLNWLTSFMLFVLRKVLRDPGFHCGGICHLICLRLLLFLCLASERRREGHAWSGEVGRGRPSRCSLGSPPWLLFLHLLFRLSAAPIICGMGFFSFRRCSMLGWKMYSLSRGTPCAGDRPAPQAAGRLFAVCPDVAELLAVMVLRKTILSSICLHPDSDVAEVFN